jgi:hypothetical protein
MGEPNADLKICGDYMIKREKFIIVQRNLKRKEAQEYRFRMATKEQLLKEYKEKGDYKPLIIPDDKGERGC